MVKILSNGEIVPDDDPRVRASTSRGGNSDDRPRPRQGYVRHEDYGDQQQGMYGQQVSIFDSLNQRLLAAGIPRWNAGPYTIEPIVSVGFLLAGLVLGLKGILFALVLFAVAKMSQGGGGFPGFGGAFRGFGGGTGQTPPGGNSGNSGGSTPRGGGGQRLGRS